MKILLDGKIQVEKGDTLFGIYGPDWKKLSGYTGDPTKLPIGTILPAKPAGSLAGTLGKEEEKTLPTTSVDKLSMFEDVLKMVTQRTAQEGKAAAGVLTTGILPEPSKVSGGTFADVLGLVTKEKTRGISDIYESTLKMLEDTRTRADRQLTMLINTKGLIKLDETSLRRLSNLTEYPYEYLLSMKNAMIEEETSPTKLTDADRISQLNTFLKDKIGEDGKISAQSYLAAYKKWIEIGGSVNDFKYAYPVEEWLGFWEYGNLPSGWKPSETEGKINLQEATKAMSAQLDKVVGGDGYVSPNDYKTAKRAWVKETGLSAKQFDEAMSIYRNPDNDYEIE